MDIVAYDVHLCPHCSSPMSLPRWIPPLPGGLSRLADLLTHDFCPGANRWVDWLKHPSVPLFLGLGMSLATAVCLAASAWILVCGLGLVLLLGGVWPWVSLRGIQARLEFQQSRGVEGEPTPAVLEIINRSPWPVWGLTLKQGFRRWPGVGPAWALARVAGWSTSRVPFDFVPDSRGEYPCGLPCVTTSFPFGLWLASRPVVVQNPLLVWPRRCELASIPDAPDVREWSDNLSARRTGDQGDLTGTRLFRPGDSLRRVHWAQTARHGRLITAERQAVAQSAATVELHLDSESHSTPGPQGTLEWTIRVAASVCSVLQAQHAAVDLCLAGERIPVVGDGVLRQRWLDRLARVPHEGLPASSRRASFGKGRGLRLFCTTFAGMTHDRAGVQGGGWWIVVQPGGEAAEGETVLTGAGRVAVRLVLPVSMAGEDLVSDGVEDSSAGAGLHQAWERIELQFRQQWEQSCHGMAVAS